MIGFAGMIVGFVLGGGSALAVNRFRVIRLGPAVDFIDRLPMHIEALDVALSLLASLAISALATRYAPRPAARLSPT